MIPEQVFHGTLAADPLSERDRAHDATMIENAKAVFLVVREYELQIRSRWPDHFERLDSILASIIEPDGSTTGSVARLKHATYERKKLFQRAAEAQRRGRRPGIDANRLRRFGDSQFCRLLRADFWSARREVAQRRKRRQPRLELLRELIGSRVHPRVHECQCFLERRARRPPSCHELAIFVVSRWHRMSEIDVRKTLSRQSDRQHRNIDQ